MKINLMIQNDQAMIRTLFHTSLASNDTGGQEDIKTIADHGNQDDNNNK